MPRRSSTSPRVPSRRWATGGSTSRSPRLPRRSGRTSISRGWSADRLLWLRHEAPLPSVARAAVSEVPYDAVAHLREQWNRERRQPEEHSRAFAAQAREVALRRGLSVLAAEGAGATRRFRRARRREGGSAEITHAYVDRARRGQGLGAALTAAAIELAGDPEDLWICADDEDRPKRSGWAAGFRDVWRSMSFELTPPAGPRRAVSPRRGRSAPAAPAFFGQPPVSDLQVAALGGLSGRPAGSAARRLSPPPARLPGSPVMRVLLGGGSPRSACQASRAARRLASASSAAASKSERWRSHPARPRQTLRTHCPAPLSQRPQLPSSIGLLCWAGQWRPRTGPRGPCRFISQDRVHPCRVGRRPRSASSSRSARRPAYDRGMARSKKRFRDYSPAAAAAARGAHPPVAGDCRRRRARPSAPAGRRGPGQQVPVAAGPLERARLRDLPALGPAGGGVMTGGQLARAGPSGGPASDGNRHRSPRLGRGPRGPPGALHRAGGGEDQCAAGHAGRGRTEAAGDRRRPPPRARRGAARRPRRRHRRPDRRAAAHPPRRAVGGHRERGSLAGAARRQGVGTALLEDIIDRARAEGCCKVQLLSGIAPRPTASTGGPA